MTNNNLYVIGPKTVFDAVYEDYVAKGFENKGAIRVSNDGTKVLVEERPELFEQSELDQAEFTGNNAEVQTYIQARPNEWQPPDIDELL